MGNVVTLPNLEGLITAGQAADMMGVSTDYLYRIRRAGWLREYTRVGRTLLYEKRAIETYIVLHPGLGRSRRVV